MAHKAVSISLLIVTLLLAACGTVATPAWSQQAKGTEAALASTSENLTAIAPTTTPTTLPATATSTALPPTATSVPATEMPSPVPPTDAPVPPTEAPTVAAGIPGAGGNPEAGKIVFNTTFEQTNFACATCHYPDKEDRLIGPGLKGIGQRAAARVPGETNAQYIYNSITNPSAYVVPDYPDGLMPQIWGQVLTPQQLNDVIAYLMTL